MDTNTLIKIAMKVANEEFVYTEYEYGTDDSYCACCCSNLSRNEPHDDDCSVVQAQIALGDLWAEKLLEDERIRLHKIEEEARIEKKRLSKIRKLTCKLCGHISSNHGNAKNHVNSIRCKKNVKALSSKQ